MSDDEFLTGGVTAATGHLVIRTTSFRVRIIPRQFSSSFNRPDKRHKGQEEVKKSNPPLFVCILETPVIQLFCIDQTARVLMFVVVH